MDKKIIDYVNLIDEVVMKPHRNAMMKKITQKQLLGKYKPTNYTEPHWRSLPLEKLISHLKDEVRELEEAVKSGIVEDVIYEAADVSNLAMMISDTFQTNSKREEKCLSKDLS